MTTQEVANRLVALCREHKGMQALEELYDKEIVSTEVNGKDSPQMSRVMKGIDAVRKKSEWWYANHTVHSGTSSDPLVAGAYFSVAFKFDVTNRPMNMRMTIEEIAVYCVKNGKIVDEQFFYVM